MTKKEIVAALQLGAGNGRQHLSGVWVSQW